MTWGITELIKESQEVMSSWHPPCFLFPSCIKILSIFLFSHLNKRQLSNTALLGVISQTYTHFGTLAGSEVRDQLRWTEDLDRVGHLIWNYEYCVWQIILFSSKQGQNLKSTFNCNVCSTSTYRTSRSWSNHSQGSIPVNGLMLLSDQQLSEVMTNQDLARVL